LGQKEAMDNTVILRDMKSGVQETIELDKITEELKKRFKNVIV
jgi:histidyl-tRNA synthetase